MNILIIAQYFPPDFGGASTRAFNIAKALRLQGCNVKVVSAFPHYPTGNIPKKYGKKLLVEENSEEMKIFRTWVPKLSHTSNFKRVFIHFSFFFSSLLAIRKIGKVDLIFASNASFFISFPALAYKLILRKNFIRNVDDLWPEVWFELGYVKSKFSKKFLEYISRDSYNKSIAVVPVSHGYVPTLISKYNLDEKKVTVIEHGVDTSKFYKINSNSEEKKIKTVMYSGSLGQGYDFDMLLNCAKLLGKKPIHFVIRGRGELENKIKKMIKEKNLSNIELDTTFLLEEELNRKLNEADIFVLPMSNIKGFDQGLPTKILEYQAIGKPIACVSNNEPGKYIERTKSGLVTPSRNPEDFAKIILRLVEEQKLAKECGENGHNYVQTNLTLEKIGIKLMKIIKNNTNTLKNNH